MAPTTDAPTPLKNVPIRLHGYRVPTNASPGRPLATYDRYLAVRVKAEVVEKRRLFRPFLDLVEGRVRAKRRLRTEGAVKKREEGCAEL
jgi:hypothetical protein